MLLKNMPENDKLFLDGSSLLAVIGTLTGLLPHIAAVMTVVWTGIRIYETDTVQKLIWGDKNDKSDNK